jgi:hypothetical protein
MKILHKPSWRVEGSYYHSLNTAIAAAVERMTCDILIKAYRRRQGLMYHPTYDYDAFHDRCTRRITKVMRASYNKRLV